MKVILLEDVKSLGKKGEIININDGYARNYVLPKKLGVEANQKNLNDLKLKQANEAKKQKELLEQAKELALKVEEKPVIVSIKAGEGGRTFGSVSTKEISQAVSKQLGFELDKKKMQLEEPIRALGMYIVPVKLHKDVTAKLSVKVEEAK